MFVRTGTVRNKRGRSARRARRNSYDTTAHSWRTAIEHEPSSTGSVSYTLHPENELKTFKSSSANSLRCYESVSRVSAQTRYCKSATNLSTSLHVPGSSLQVPLQAPRVLSAENIVSHSLGHRNSSVVVGVHAVCYYHEC